MGGFLEIIDSCVETPLLDGLNTIHPLSRSEMNESGFCLKCKSYGTIRNPKRIQMSNGRMRVAGFCSNQNCGGRISKIVG